MSDSGNLHQMIKNTVFRGELLAGVGICVEGDKDVPAVGISSL